MANNSFINRDESVLAERISVSDLPGLFSKKVSIGASEHGLLMHGRSSTRDLQNGVHKVGWSFLGIGGNSQSFVRTRGGNFQIRIPFSNLISKGYEKLDAVFMIEVTINDHEQFANYVIRDAPYVTDNELGGLIAANVDEILQITVSKLDGQYLKDDQELTNKTFDDLSPHFNSALEQKGLLLVNKMFAAFYSTDEPEKIAEELSALRSMVSSARKPSIQEVDRTLKRLISTGLIPDDIAERAQLLHAGGTDSSFLELMSEIIRTCEQRLESDVLGKAAMLSEKSQDSDGENSKKSAGNASSFENSLKFIGPICGIAGIIYKISSTVILGWFVMGGALAASLILMILYGSVKAKRILKTYKKDDPDIVLDKWISRKSMSSDIIIRRQIGRELDNASSNVNAAKLAAHRNRNTHLSSRLDDLESQFDTVKIQIESASTESSLVSSRKYPRARIKKLIEFEEALIRDARNLSIRADELKETNSDEPAEALFVGVENLRQTFNNRQSYLEGFKQI